MTVRLARPLAILGIALLLAGCREAPRPEAHHPAEDSIRLASSDPVLVGAGDIGRCATAGDEATARLLDRISGTVFTAGDNAYPDGTRADFRWCYAPSWGRHRARTRPAPGNHDYHVSGAPGYFDYFGKAAGPARRGYYAYDLGAWRVYSLNSNISMLSSSPQVTWLKQDLAANHRRCVLAYWHHPRFSSGWHGNSPSTQPLWEALYDAGADVVISAHDHDYERFDPQTPWGGADSSRGIREFVVGTGGAKLRPFRRTAPNSRVRYAGGHGVLRLMLMAEGYRWQFITTDGTTRDAGNAACH